MVIFRILIAIGLGVFLTWKAFHLYGPPINDDAGPKVIVRISDRFHFAQSYSSDDTSVKRVSVACNARKDGIEGDFWVVDKFPVRVYVQIVDKGGVWDVRIPLTDELVLAGHSDNLTLDTSTRGWKQLIYRADPELGQRRVVLHYDVSHKDNGIAPTMPGRVITRDYFNNRTVLYLPSVLNQKAFCELVNRVSS